MTQKSQLFPVYGFTTQNVAFIIDPEEANAHRQLKTSFSMPWSGKNICPSAIVRNSQEVVENVGEYLAIWELINGSNSTAF